MDYSGGHVLPGAITLGTLGLVKPRNDSKIFVYSKNFPNQGVMSFDIFEDLQYVPQDGWLNFVKGVVLFVKKAGYPVEKGFNLLVDGNIPNGAGLSSSASLELLLGVIIADVNNIEIPRLDLIKIGQRVENLFIGVNSGIMDQFAVGMGNKDSVLYLNVNNLDYEVIPVNFDGYKILIMNTNKRRELTDSKYNERRFESDEALKRLKSKLLIENLGDLSIEEFEKNKDLIQDEILIRRARHAVHENVRTQKAKKALQEGNILEMGRLMNASHRSLKNDYDVTGIELDTLVESAWANPNVLGARMTGAGMGGCAIAIVKENSVDEVISQIAHNYESIIGYAPTFYIAEIGIGTSKLS
ncbi:galactokinase [Aerococcus urinaeequi]|uniref:galactokinase n=1 Tax=Aerococcus urinaeequi TaxID=51665 RepID=UPI002DDCD427|nr:galactokinase [Aerococcus urinaeequi]